MSQADSPMRMKAAFMRTFGVAIRTSLASASAKPPPAAAPLTQAMIGCGQRRLAVPIPRVHLRLGGRAVDAGDDPLRAAPHGDHDLADLPLAGQPCADRAASLAVAAPSGLLQV